MNKRVIFLGILLVITICVKIFLPNYLFYKGKSCYEHGNSKCAIDNLKKAYELNLSNIDYEYYYAKALTTAKADYNVQKELYKLSKNAKSESAKLLAINTIKEWKSRIMYATGNNYIEQAPSDTNIIRWNKESFPLSVYITKEVGVPDYYDSAIRRSLALWSKSVSFVDFKIVNNKSEAQIIIDIKPLPSDVCNGGICQYVLGYTTPTILGHTLKKMTMTLYDKNPSGMYFADKEIFNTVAHELGHALGIMGHSYSADDLMYPSQSEHNTVYDKFKSDFHSLSGKDINTITLLYRLEPTITDKAPDKKTVLYTPIVLGDNKDIATKKLEEAEDYIKASPNIAAGYVDLASAYAELGKIKDAEDALQKALSVAKTNDEKSIIYHNLALLNYQSKKYKDAKTYLNQAKQYKMSPELIELENQILDKLK